MHLEKPTHILAPVDFSELSAQALRYAEALARCSGARITVLYANAFEAPPYFTQGQLAELGREFRESQRQAERELREFVRKTLGPEATEPAIRVIEGRPVEAIRRTAAEAGADLIAMGTHGRSGINRFMLGSVTERVLRETDVPVLTVRRDAPLTEPPAIRNILCPVNHSAVARKSLAVASQFAHCFGATLTVLHVREARATDSIDDLCAWVPKAHRSECQVREASREGEASHEIVALASELPCDLLVMGAQHHRFLDSTVIGTTTVRVVRHAPCPVLTVISRDPVVIEQDSVREVRHAV